MQELVQIIRDLETQSGRKIIAIAGPPAAGKSTLAQSLCEAFGDDLAILPMDGFHLDNDILDAHDMHARKGAPESFDVDGFVNMVKRVHNGEAVYAPKFDRKLDLSRGSAIPIDGQEIIIIEGNYLLLNRIPWTELRQYWDLSLWLDVPIEIVEKRCIERWLEHDHGLEDAKRRARENDVRNAQFVIENSAKADIVLDGT